MDHLTQIEKNIWTLQHIKTKWQLIIALCYISNQFQFFERKF